MSYVDSALLNLTGWLCRRFQVLTGRTNAWVAVQLTHLSIVVYFVWAAVYFWNTDVVLRTAVALFCGALLYTLSQTLLKVPIEAYENSAYHRVGKGLRNPRRVHDALLRTSFLTLSIVLLYPVVLVFIHGRAPIVLLTYSLIVLMTVVLYVLACDPLPPCGGRVWEWVRGSVQPQVARPESTNR